jgi:hypothetical protein
MSYINVIVDCPNFLNTISELVKKQNIYCYFQYRNTVDKIRVHYVEVDFNNANFEELMTDEYDQFFFSSKEIDTQKAMNFYQDGIYEYAVEGNGGRKTSTELELLSLRIISKNPDKKINSFFKSINIELKKNSNYDQGIGETSNQKKIFYLKEIVGKYQMWHDFKRKVIPISIT